MFNKMKSGRMGLKIEDGGGIVDENTEGGEKHDGETVLRRCLSEGI